MNRKHFTAMREAAPKTKQKKTLLGEYPFGVQSIGSQTGCITVTHACFPSVKGKNTDWSVKCSVTKQKYIYLEESWGLRPGK